MVGIVAYAAVGNTLTFAPAANLAPSTQYTATITTGVTDLSGTPLASSLHLDLHNRHSSGHNTAAVSINVARKYGYECAHQCGSQRNLQ